VRLEPAFWTTLEAIAADEGMSTPAFISKLYDEVLDLHGEVQNFTSLLRCACLTFLERAHPFPARMAAE
jgi:predicted DNA-binding ribbon-helix-helix protein